MAQKPTPYRTAEPVPAEDDDVEVFRAQLGANHRWAQRVTGVHGLLRRVAGVIGKVTQVARWLDNPAREARFALFDVRWDATPWSRERRRREQALLRKNEPKPE